MEKESLRILVIDPDPSIQPIVQGSLRRSGLPAVLRFITATDGIAARLKPGQFDVILSEHKPPAVNLLRTLHLFRELNLEIPIILLTHEGDFRMVREAFKSGISDCLLKEELEAVSLFDVVTSVLETNRARQETRDWTRRLQEQAERDGLTLLYNHRHFLEVLEREFLRAGRYHRPLSLLMIDLDEFKSINDTLGHPQGDQVLAMVAQLISRSVRHVDLVARYGGDEFAVLLPETGRKAALRLGERILKEIHRHPYLHGPRIFPLSASIGIGSYHPSLSGAGALLREADQCLYAAKRGGRGRVVSGPLNSTDVFADVSATHLTSEICQS